MAMDAGDVSASSGMSKAIYDMVKTEIIDNMTIKPQKIDKMEAQLKKLAFCIAKGVIDHIKSSMGVKGIQVSEPTGTVETYVAGVGNNGGTLVAGTYPVVGNVVKATSSFTQNNDGTGHVE